MHRMARHPNGVVAVVASNRFPRARSGNRTGSVHTHLVAVRMLSRSATVSTCVQYKTLLNVRPHQNPSETTTV